MMHNVLDLFCGAGGFSTGFIQAGFNIKYAIDNDPKVQETYEYNHPNTKFILADILMLDPHDYKDIDVIIGSPPCQEFSYANNKGNPNKGMELVRVYLNWIKIIQPKWWIMENVPAVEKFLKWRITDFNIPIIKVLNCADYGVPQKRRRMFAGNYKIPKPTHSKHGGITLFGDKICKWVTVQDAIGDLMLIEPNNNDENNHECYNFNEEKNNPEFIGKWQGLKKIDLNKSSSTITDNHGNTNLIPNHNNYKSSQESMKHQLENGKYGVSKNKQVDVKQPSNTVICNEKDQGPILNVENIILTHRRGKATKDTWKPYYDKDEPSNTIAGHPHRILNEETKQAYRRLTVRECVKPDTLILGDENKMIKDYDLKDKCIGMKKLNNIDEILKRKYEGEIIKIKAMGCLELEITPNHPIYIITGSKNRKINFSNPLWKPAKDLRVKKYQKEGEYVLIPKLKGVIKNKSYNLNNWMPNTSQNHHKWRESKNLPIQIKLDKNLAWILGLYVAEGSNTKRELNFSLGRKEKLLKKKLKRKLLKIGVYSDKRELDLGLVDIIRVYSTPLSNLFENLCGKLAHNKKIPNDILFNEDLNILKSFLNGYVLGDGYCRFQTNNLKISATTVSQQLVLQLQLLLARLNLFGKIYKRNRKNSYIDGRELKGKPQYIINYIPNIKDHTSFKNFNDFIATPIKEICKEKYNGLVYNFETEDHTYLISNIITHNCARLQSFPDNFIFFGSLSAQYKMVGNSVPPLMSYHLAKMLEKNI